MKKLAKKLLGTFAAILLAVPQWVPYVYADNNITQLQISSTQVMEIDGTDSTRINYYTNAEKTTLAGYVQVMLSYSPGFLTPNNIGDDLVYDTYATEVVVELNPNITNGYQAPRQYKFGNNEMPLAATNFNLTLTSGITNLLNFNFVEDNGGNPQGPDPIHGDEGENMPGPMVRYPILAQFDVQGQSPIDVRQNEEGSIVIPEDWMSGKVTFKAEIFKKQDGTVEPYENQTAGGQKITEDLDIEGIANGEEIHETVTGGTDRKSITIQEGFSDYGKLQLHLMSNVVNQTLNVVHKNLINIKAISPFSLSQSFGTVALNQAIITKDEIKEVKIFFGNTETTLIVSGSTVDKITEVTGSTLKNVSLNEDGSATVTLPALKKETTIPVKLTIKKSDGSYIKRSVNIVRTAIQLGHSYEQKKPVVNAGYVVNKGYLYNNQSHNDAIFNAYLQVIIYKDDAVAGYKQIKIDDETLINTLNENESGSLELYSENQIPIYGKNAGNFIDGVNKVSVFLTNGPIDVDGDTLPSIEFGIGSGVTCEWEES